MVPGGAAAGCVIALFRPAARSTLFLLIGIGLQAGVLFLQARADGNTSAYMSFKTFYLAPYPLAALAVLPPAFAWQLMARMMRASPFSAPFGPVAGQAIVWTLTLLVGYRCCTGRSSRRSVKRRRSEPLWQAGRWARDASPTRLRARTWCRMTSGVWLHLAVLRSPRMSSRTADDATSDVGDTIIRWYAPVGLPFAIADMLALTRDVRTDLDVLAEFGGAAVVRRRGDVADERLRRRHNGDSRASVPGSGFWVLGL